MRQQEKQPLRASSNDFTTSSKTLLEQAKRRATKASLYGQYQELKEAKPSGILLLPDLKSSYVFHGVVFIRQGLFKGGVFCFELSFHDEKSNTNDSENQNHHKSPILRFNLKDHLFHPFVHPQTGLVDVKTVFVSSDESSRTSNLSLLQLALKIKQLFYLREKDRILIRKRLEALKNNDKRRISNYYKWNKEAALLLSSDLRGFALRANRAVLASLSTMKTNIKRKDTFNKNKNNPLCFTAFCNEHGELKKKLIKELS